MATETKHANIRRHSDNALLYGVTTVVDTALYPRTNNGEAGFKAAVKAGSFELTVDNGAIIPQGTVPPLVKPSPPGSGPIAAFSQKIQAENATGSGTFDGEIGDGTTRGWYITSADYLIFQVLNAPITDDDYKIAIRYQTNFDTGLTGETGSMRIIINSGSPQDIVTEGAAGGFRTHELTNQNLTQGTNSIRIEGSMRPFRLDYVLITRPETQ